MLFSGINKQLCYFNGCHFTEAENVIFCPENNNASYNSKFCLFLHEKKNISQKSFKLHGLIGQLHWRVVSLLTITSKPYQRSFIIDGKVPEKMRLYLFKIVFFSKIETGLRTNQNMNPFTVVTPLEFYLLCFNIPDGV